MFGCHDEDSYSRGDCNQSGTSSGHFKQRKQSQTESHFCIIGRV